MFQCNVEGPEKTVFRESVAILEDSSPFERNLKLMPDTKKLYYRSSINKIAGPATSDLFRSRGKRSNILKMFHNFNRDVYDLPDGSPFVEFL